MSVLNIGQVRAEMLHHLPLPAAVDTLLVHVLKCTRTQLYSWPEQIVDDGDKQALLKMLRSHLAGKPIAHIVGNIEFFSLDFRISSQVLLPRPETEILVEHIVQSAKPKAQVLELGTGCGAVAVAVACTRPDLNITATDISYDAIAVAQSNAQYHDVNIHFIQGDWYQAVVDTAMNKTFDLIVSNPPYISTRDPDLDPSVADHEPPLALFAGKDGLDSLRTIINGAPQYLSNNGSLIVEHGMRQQQIVATLMHEAGLSDIKCLKDMADLPRVSMGTYAD